MTPAMLAQAAELVYSKPHPVLIHLIRTPGSEQLWPTEMIPVGRTRWVTVGRYTPDITLGELRDDILAAERAFDFREQSGREPKQ